MTPHLISVEDIKKVQADNYVTYLKWVRIGNEYRFALAGEWCTPDHKQMVNEGEIPVSAGYFKLYKDRLETEGWSSTLKIGSKPDDSENLAKLFQLY